MEARTAGDEVVLRAAIASDLDCFEADLATPEGTGIFQWFGPGSARAMRQQFAENGLRHEAGGTLTIDVRGEVAGRVEWFEASWGRRDSVCWTIAIGLRPGWRGRGVGTFAHRALVTRLFAETPVRRIQAYTDVENVAERRALEKAGFALEGIVRASQLRAGAWHDLALYAVLRPAVP